MAAHEPKAPADVPTQEPLSTSASDSQPGSTPQLGTGAGPPSDPKQMQDFLWKVHGYTNDYIRFADTKAAFCLGLASALMAALIRRSFPGTFVAALRSSHHFSIWTLLVLAALTFLVGSIVASVMTVRPRLITRSQKGFIFWEAISSFDGPGAFTAAYSAQPERELTECLAHHVYTLAHVCRRKYLWVNLAIVAVVVGGAMAIVLVLFT
ncbi:MAG: Pycsar system effector family protein [Candidatus Acidiferrales bacterium]